MQQGYTRRPGDSVLRPTRYRDRAWRILLPSIPQPRTSGSSSLVLIYGFLGLIVLGTILLTLPVSTKTGQWTSLIDALFTATSAVCVTGLVVVDTADYWSFFGQLVIIILIQIGGFGFMTSATVFLLTFGRRIGLQERLLIRESMGLAQLGGLDTIVKRMAAFTLLTEIIGATIFYLYFYTQYSTDTAVWVSIFQSISAFNNAGFDLFGSFRSLIDYQNNPQVMLTTAALIFLGGISFLVVFDIGKSRRWGRLSLDTKVVLTTTLCLLAFGMVVILFTEWNNPDTFGVMSYPQKLLNAFFQSVTARTAGFSTINIANVADYTLFVIMLLMFVGGASGSTAGGVKANTFGILVAAIWSTIRGRENAIAFGRRFNTQQIYRALTLVMFSLSVVTLVVFILTVTEGSKFIDLLFESFSAFGTVGLSSGITTNLSTAGRILITITMFIGRLGPLTLVLALIQRQRSTPYRYPEEIVRIG